MIFLGGTDDMLTATGGAETVQAYKGGNSITTGAGNLPGANQGNDTIYGWVVQNADKFHLGALLATTG
jgi:hypothetical protein